MNVKYVLVGYLSLSFLCCLFCFYFDRTILLHFHPTRHAVPHPTNSPSSLPSWPLQLVAQPVVPPLHQSQALPPHSETGKPGHVDAFPAMTSGFAVCSQNCSATMRKPLLLKGCKDDEISFCVSVGGSLNSTSMVGVLYTIIQESKLAVREASNRIIQPSSWVCINLFQEQYGTSRGHGSQPCEFHVLAIQTNI